MSILIKCMEMPKYCCACPCHNGENGRCQITKEVTDSKRPYDCPLIEVPTPYAEPKKGKWIIEKRDPQDIYEHALCSECGAYWSNPFMVASFDFCPHCGTKMETK